MCVHTHTRSLSDTMQEMKPRRFKTILSLSVFQSLLDQ